MRGMADGGIAGYGDGDDVPRQNGMAQGGMYDFAQRSEPVLRMSGGGAVQKFAGKGEQLVRTTDGGKTWFLDIPKTIRDPSVPYYRLIPNPAAALADMKFPSKAAALEAVTTASTQYSGTPGAKPYSLDLGSALPTVDNRYVTPEGERFIRNAEMTDKEFNKEKKQGIRQNQIPTFAGPDAPIVPRFQPGVSDAFVPPAAAASDVAAPPAAAPSAAVPPAAVPGAAPAPQATLPTGIATIKQPTAADAKSKAADLYDSKGQILSLEGKRLQAREDIFGETRERLAQLEAFNKKQGPAYAGYEKLLQKEELQDATDKEKSGLMSLMKGFLAMAAGESPNAATNIAKGAMVGLGDYGDALKEFKKAAKERTKAMADIENARRAEAKGDFKDQRTFEDRAAERIAASDDRFTGLISQITGKEADVAASLFNNMTNITEETNRMMFKEAQLNKRFNAEQAGLNARALMPSGEARTAMMLGTGNTQAERLKSGMAVLQELSTDKSGAKTVETLAKINSDRAKNGEPPISMADLVASAREYSALMYPKVGNDAPTRAR